MRIHRVAAALAALATLGAAAPVAPAGTPQAPALTVAQRQDLRQIAERTWSFYAVDVDPATNLPRDYGSDVAGPPPGDYTSPTDIGMGLWAIVSARDLGLISAQEALDRANAALTAIEGLRKWNGFLLSWYDTGTGSPITGP